MRLSLLLAIGTGFIIWFGLIGRIGLKELLLGVLVVWSGWLLLTRLPRPRGRKRLGTALRRLARLGAFLLMAVLPESLRAAWQVCGLILGRYTGDRSGLVSVHLKDASTEALFLMAWSVTLSPSQQVVDIDEPRRTLLIHVLDAADPHDLQLRLRRRYNHYIKEILP